MTSPRPCWWSRIKAPFSFGNETPFSWKFCEKKLYWIDQPAWPPCHVVANQKKYFNFIWTLQIMLYCHFFGISLMKVLLLCSQEVVKGPNLNEGALWKKIFSALWSSVILWWWVVVWEVYLPTLTPAGWKLRSHAGSCLRANFSRLIEKRELLPFCLTQFPKIC